jgi:hypothetical protein
MTNVKGSAFASRILWVRLHHGEEGVQRVMAALSPPARELVGESPVRARWYPFDSFVELNLVIDRLFGQGDLSLVWTLGKHGADVNLRTVYRLFYMVGTPKWIMDRATRLWNMHYDSGHLVATRGEGNEIDVEIVDFETPHRTHCQSVFGWCERSLELSGAKELQLQETACRALGDASCRLHLTWS